MFKFLKDKLKKAVSKFSKDVEEEAEDIEVEALPEEKVEDEGKAVKKPVKKSKPKPEKKEEVVSPVEEKPGKEEPEEEAKPEEKKAVEERPAVEAEPEKEEVPEKSEKSPGPEEAPAKELGAELQGLKEGLESYSDEDLDSLMSILGFTAEDKGKSRDEKIGSILEKPLLEISSAMDKLEAVGEDEAEKEDVPEVQKRLPEKEEEVKPEEERPARTAQDILDETDEEDVPEEAGMKEEAPKEKKTEAEEEGAPKTERKEGFFRKLFRKKKEEEPAEVPEEKVPEPEEKEKAKEEPAEVPEEKVPEPEEKEKTEEEPEKALPVEKEPEAEEPEEGSRKGFFGKIRESFTLKRLSESKFDDIFFELEIALLENNVAVEVIEKIRTDLRDRMVDRKLKKSEIGDIVIKSLKESLEDILDVGQVDILERIKEKGEGPFVIVFVGINGSGKTTTIAKMAKFFMDKGLKPVMVASDTFRAAAIQQLEEHANNLGVKMIKHDYGSDPAAVAFDGIKYAKSKGNEVVLIDTAGRLHSNTNLMDEMKKIMRVADPDMKIFIGESITGNDCIEQAQKFNEAIDIDGIVLSKADVDEKGGAAISISYVTGKPILFIGTGQTYDSLEPFDKSIVLDHLGLA